MKTASNVYLYLSEDKKVGMEKTIENGTITYELHRNLSGDNTVNRFNSTQHKYPPDQKLKPLTLGENYTVEIFQEGTQPRYCVAPPPNSKK
jgi:hypothetical protein